MAPSRQPGSTPQERRNSRPGKRFGNLKQHQVLSDLPVVAVVSMNPRTVNMACEIDIFIMKQQAADTTRKGIKNDFTGTFLSRSHRHTGSALHRFSGATQSGMAGAGACGLRFSRSHLPLVLAGCRQGNPPNRAGFLCDMPMSRPVRCIISYRHSIPELFQQLYPVLDRQPADTGQMHLATDIGGGDQLGLALLQRGQLVVAQLPRKFRLQQGV